MDRFATLRTLGVTALAAAFGAAISTWPLVRAPATVAIGDGRTEVADHIHALWMGLGSGPLVADSPLVDWPRGARWVLADPVNLLWYAPGSLLGPVAGYNLVQFANVALAGLAAAAIGASVLGQRRAAPFAAFAGATLPPLAGGLSSGMTDAQTLGWAGLAVAASWQAFHADRRWVLAAGAALGVCAWSGSYTALYAGIAVSVLAIAAGARAALPRLAVAVGIAAILAAPVALAIQERDPMLPGSRPLAAQVARDPDAPKNRALSGDLSGLFWPGRGVDATAAIQTSYLGLALWTLAAAGAVAHRRDRDMRALLALIAVFLVLGLGYQLQVGGTPVRVAGHVVPMPAAALSRWIPVVGRAVRWYRAHVVAGVLLVPVATAGAVVIADRLGRPRAIVVMAAIVAMDAVLTGSLPWPRPSVAATPPPALLALPGTGPILEIPVPSAGWGRRDRAGKHPRPDARNTMLRADLPDDSDHAGPDPASRNTTLRLRNAGQVWQAWDGRARGGNLLSPVGPDPAVERAGEALAHGTDVREQAAALGFEWLVFLADGHPEDPGAAGLRAALGPPDVDEGGVVAWATPALPAVPSR